MISNALAQRHGSAVTVGVAVCILSLPTGTPVTIAALCEHFTEGEILISRALRELEAAGYLERRRERLSTGQIRTRTYFYDVPGGDPDLDTDPDGPPEPPKPRRPRKQPAAAAVTPVPASAAVEETAAAPAQAEAEALGPLDVQDGLMAPTETASYLGRSGGVRSATRPH